jgi:hypothetical protein
MRFRQIRPRCVHFVAKRRWGLLKFQSQSLAKLICFSQQIGQRLAGSLLTRHEDGSLDADQIGMAENLRTFAFNERP